MAASFLGTRQQWGGRSEGYSGGRNPLPNLKPRNRATVSPFAAPASAQPDTCKDSKPTGYSGANSLGPAYPVMASRHMH